MKDGGYVDLATVGAAIAAVPSSTGTPTKVPEARPGKVIYETR
jgi:hypothetical protein